MTVFICLWPLSKQIISQTDISQTEHKALLIAKLGILRLMPPTFLHLLQTTTDRRTNKQASKQNKRANSCHCFDVVFVVSFVCVCFLVSLLFVCLFAS